jgi:HK97 family phage major capsid protein
MKKLLEQRAAIVAKMRALTAAPAGQNGDLSEAQAREFDAHKTELDGIEARIERQRVMDEAERRMEGKPLNTSGDDHLDAELRKFSLVRAIASQVPDLAGRVDFGREIELSRELAKRSGMQYQGIAIPMQVFEKRVTTTVDAGDLIATNLLSGQFIDTLRNALVIKRLGARVLSGLVGNVDIPKRTGSATAGWFAENAAITPSDHTFDKLSMTPKHVGAITEFSRNMLLQSSPDIEALVRDDFAQILAEAVDLAAIQGGGTNEPSGLLDQDDLDTSVSNATTWAKVLELIETVSLANSEGSAFLTDPSVVRKLRTTAKVSSTDSVMVMQDPNSLAGYPLTSSNIVPIETTNHNLIFGKWGDILLGYWSVFDLLVNPYESTAYSKGNVSVRGIITADVQIRHIESFAASVDVTV